MFNNYKGIQYLQIRVWKACISKRSSMLMHQKLNDNMISV